MRGIVYLPVRVKYPMVRPNQIAAEMVWEMASSMSVRGRFPCSSSMARPHWLARSSQRSRAGRLGASCRW